MATSAHRILVIDDDRLFLEIARYNLEHCGYDVTVVADPRAGVNLAIERRFDLILLDLMMPGMRGEEVLSLLKPLGGHQRILVISGHTGGIYRSRARDLGAVGYVEKPLSAEDLRLVVGELLGSELSTAGESEYPPEKSVLELPVRWVFGVGAVTPLKCLVAAGVLIGFLCVSFWLVLG